MAHHVMSFHVQFDDTGFTTYVHVSQGVVEEKGVLPAERVSIHEKAEIAWTDGVDLTLSCMFAKCLTRWMESTGLEPWSF